MKILVTGGAGYIGSHTVEKLIEAGHNPVVVDNFSTTGLDNLAKIYDAKYIPVINVDCAHPDLEQAFRNYKIGAIIHFAAYKDVNESVSNPLKYYRNNLLSLINLLELMKKYKVGKLVFSSSCAVYGDCESPVSEEAAINPKSPYGFTKSMGEQIIKDSGISACILRYFNPIGGKYKDWSNSLCNNLKKDNFKIYGNDYDTKDGTCVRDFINVEDLADAHIKALNLSDTFNVGTGKGTTVLELVNEYGVKYEFAPRRKGDIEKIWADTKKWQDTE
jgi:UDP-glucose 4-epimerase